MFPSYAGQHSHAVAFLCLRRGVSQLCAVPEEHRRFSLPTQRCFRVKEEVKTTGALFSAYAEVFLWIESLCAPGVPFLCLRRGVSDRYGRSAFVNCFSLPTQRCFYLRRRRSLGRQLFSAYAEVFQRGLRLARAASAFLCLRRGVSPGLASSLPIGAFSLPTQRCFLFASAEIFILRLFSAYAEVFPSSQPLSRFVSPFLCLRRGVSAAVNLNGDFISFSLPTQRCFCKDPPLCSSRSLFSAYAEVFPRRRARGVRRCTFLCLRRGVSVRCPHPPIQRDFSLPTQRCFPLPPFFLRFPKTFLCLRRGVS